MTNLDSLHTSKVVTGGDVIGPDGSRLKSGGQPKKMPGFELKQVPLTQSRDSVLSTGATMDNRELVSMEVMEENSAGPAWFNDYLRPCVAELFAVMLFVFVGTMSVQLGLAAPVAVAHGLMIMLLVASFGPISGGHINPAVTMGVCIGGGVPVVKALLYVVSQCIGGITGAAICRGSLSFTVEGTNLSRYELISGGGHALGQDVGVWNGVLAEAGLTTVLVMTVLMTAVNTDAHNVIHPICIGMAVTAGILAGFNTTGGSMNPARSLGPAVVLSSMTTKLWTNHWVYWVGPAIGALIAGTFYRIIFARPDKRIVYKED